MPTKENSSGVMFPCSASTPFIQKGLCKKVIGPALTLKGCSHGLFRAVAMLKIQMSTNHT